MLIFLVWLASTIIVWIPIMIGVLVTLLQAGSSTSMVTILGALALAMVAGGFITHWLYRAFLDPGSKSTLKFMEATRLCDTRAESAPHILVIRGVDDEASLALAAGAIGARLSAWTLRTVLPAALLILFLFVEIFSSPDRPVAWLFVILCLATLVFLVLPGVFKSVLRRELLFGERFYDIAVHSAPDMSGVTAITLPPDKASSAGQWRHTIYTNHLECVDKIIEWLRCLPDQREGG